MLFIVERVLRSTFYHVEVLKASSVSPVFKELKLDKTNSCRVGKSQVLNGWWILIPAVFKVGYEQLVPRSVVVERTKKAEFFCGAVPVAPVVCVSQSQTLSCFYTAKVHDETLLFAFFAVFRQPIVSIRSRLIVCAES